MKSISILPMNIIYLITFFASIAALALLILWYVRRQKNRQTQLRLLGGRRHILDEEIAAQTALLQAIDSRHLESLCEQAKSALDELNIALVERQAHLLNYADLAHLQEYKIQLYDGDINNTSSSPASGRPDGERENAAPTATPLPKESPKGRAQVENQLLKKIGQINRDQ